MKFYMIFLILIVVACHCDKNTTPNDTENPKQTDMGLPDLNGDGIIDTIKFEIAENKYDFTLRINDSSCEDRGVNLYADYRIVDIDTSDKFHEVAITEAGPSDDAVTHYFYFDGKEVKPVGSIASWDISVDGSGAITDRTKGEILHTWWFYDVFKLNENHRLENIRPELIEMNTPVIINKKLTLYQSRNSDEVAVELLPGENAVITLTDNKKWCLVEADNDRNGWFAIENGKLVGTDEWASSFFEGLFFSKAD